jgi:hypothetical protein
MRRIWFGAALGAALAGGASALMVLTRRQIPDAPAFCRESKGKRRRSRYEVRGW